MNNDVTYYAIQYQNAGSETVFSLDQTFNNLAAALEHRDRSWARRSYDQQLNSCKCMWIEKVTQRTVGGVLR